MNAVVQTPLAELRQGLHVSVSQVKAYVMCPKNYGESSVMRSRARIRSCGAGESCRKVT